MSCISSEKYYIDGNAYSVPVSSTDGMYTPSVDVCSVNKILDRLHNEFTEKYYTTASRGTDTTKTLVDGTANNPSYYLRNQPPSNSDTSNTQENRFYINVTNSDGSYNGIEYYRKMISAVMKGDNTNNVAPEDYDKAPISITSQTDFTSSPGSFKGIHGINKVIEILETKINTILTGLSLPPPSSSASSGDAITKFGQRKEIKNTLEEVAYRENQIYREKFLNIILIVVGIFVVGSQLVQKYFSGSDGGGGSAGLGGLFGFGFGGSGGLFSRFGGLGLGSSGRSHFDVGNLFKNSSYTLKQR